MRRHLSAEVLARYQAGDLGSRRAAKVARHLAGCLDCERTLSELTAVSSLLAGMVRPAMPAAFADRLQVAIARESAARADAMHTAAPARGVPATAPDAADAGAAAPGSAGKHAADRPAVPAHIPGRPDLPERRSRGRSARRRLRWPELSSPLLLRGAAAAAAVVVIAGAGFLLSRGTTGPTSTSGNAGRPATSHAGGGAAHRTNSGAGGFGTNQTMRLNYRRHGQSATALALVTHKNFTKAGLAAQVQREVADHPAFGPVATPTATRNGGPSVSGLLGGIRITRLSRCLSLVAAGRQVVLTELARYQGKRATIIVLKAQTAKFLDVAIVGVACSAYAADYIVRTVIPAG